MEDYKEMYLNLKKESEKEIQHLRSVIQMLRDEKEELEQELEEQAYMINYADLETE